MTTEDKFRAAVNVIRSLPKNGSYQPSHELMLRFYGFYKQATEGTCSEPQPAFWEVVKKKKWEAWSRLGNMSRNEAMENYVEELKKIVETMSYTDNVANFLGSLGSFYETVPQEDLEMLVGNIIHKVSSREASPQRSDLDQPEVKVNGLKPTPIDTDSEADDEEEYIDTVETDPESHPEVVSVQSMPQLNGSLHNGTSSQNGGAVTQNGDDAWHSRARNRARDRGPAVVKASLNGHAVPMAEDASSLAAQISLTSHTDSKVSWGHVNGDAGAGKDVTDQLRATVKQLQKDLERCTARVRSLEVAAQPSEVRSSSVQKFAAPSWWPLPDVSPRTAALVVLWPVVVQVAAVWWRHRRNRRSQ